MVDRRSDVGLLAAIADRDRGALLELYRRHEHRPTIVAHDLYLLGLTFLVAGIAVRGALGRRAAWAGTAAAITGIVAQVAVSPL